MSANALQERLRAGQHCVNGWLTLPSPFVAETMAQAGWDSLTIDLQHGLQDYTTAVALIQSMQRYPVVPLVRVPSNEPGVIGKVLDAGAWGVICPMINTVEDARAFAVACHYPPLGSRSYGPIRARNYGGKQPYHEIANDQVLVLAQIETREAVEHAAGILDVPGISGIYIGPNDLGLSLGLPPTLDREEPEILATYSRLLAETRRRGRVAGIHNAGAAYATRMIAMGFQLVTVASDLGLLAAAARQTVDSMRR